MAWRAISARPGHRVLADIAKHRLERRHRGRDLHLPQRERHLVAEQRAGVLQAVQQGAHRGVAADRPQREERAEALRDGEGLVEELAAKLNDTHFFYLESGGGSELSSKELRRRELNKGRPGGRRAGAGEFRVRPGEEVEGGTCTTSGRRLAARLIASPRLRLQ